MIFELSSTKSLEEIGRGLEQSAAAHKFGILTVHNLRETMRKKGVEFDGECMIYEVCNPQQAKKALEANGAISTALPCRISVYRAGSGYRLATMLPTEIMKVFNSPEIEPIAKEVEDVVIAIMRESAG